MKKTYLPTTLILLFSLFLITTQALAGPANVISAKGAPSGTPGPHIPGGQHTPGAAATAHASLHGKPTILRGTISAVNSSSLTLTLTDGSSASVGLTSDTRVKIPGPKSSGAALQVGMRAMVMAFTDANSSLVARAVMAIPGQPIRAHRVGWVTAYAAGSSITIRATDGNTYTLTLTGDTRILPSDRADQLAVGSLVTIIAPRVPSAPGLTATGIVVHPVGSGKGSQPSAASPTP